jgi:hypothetical protein
MLGALLVLLATAFPSQNKIAWMRPESFHLIVGMSRADTMKALDAGGWKTRIGKNESQLVVDYTDAQSITLDFRKDRLHSIRFEYFSFLQDARAAFDDEKTYLRKVLGKPKARVKSKTILVYDDRLPNVMVVLDVDPRTERGRQGIGMLSVRYYDPR